MVFRTLLFSFLISWFGWSSLVAQPSSSKKENIPVEIVFSHKGGFYEDELLLDLNCPGADIYYTTDGSLPNKKGIPYESPIKITQTTVIRAIAYKGDKDSPVYGHTYFINEPPSAMATVSISVSPWVLFDPEVGLFMNGSEAIDSIWRMPGANFWSKAEKIINTEIFESNGDCVFRSPTGFRLFGGMSRLFPQKSMTIVCRDDYGEKRIKHKIFGKQQPRKYKFLVLRNAGSDWGKSHFRDVLMTDLVSHLDLETQANRPARVFINGKYWGIYHIREKINRYYLESHWGNDKDSIDLIEHKMSLKRGSIRHYRSMIEFIDTTDLSNPANYAYLNRLMDVENFLDYKIAQIYFDNVDAGGNIRFWRPQTSDGRWRWILYDTDWGFGLHKEDAYSHNSLEFHTEPDGPGWPNPPWSTLILRKLLENPEFRALFINRFADHVNTTFAPQRTLALIEKHYRTLKPEMPRHLERWRLSSSRWENQVAIIRQFARERPTHTRMHLMDKFDTGKAVRLKLSCNKGGIIRLNRFVEIQPDEKFEGIYFQKIPITIEADPELGYQFSHWEGIQTDSFNRTLNLALLNDISELKAVFKKANNALTGQIIFNEISCNNNETEDWVELYNRSNQSVNLTDWIFTDTKNSYTLPTIYIPAKGYVIISEQPEKFKKYFPNVIGICGGTGFGLDKKKEKLSLYDNRGASIDKFKYKLVPQDSAFTLNLLLPHLDNSNQDNWEELRGFGTPEHANPYYMESRIKAQQETWMRMGAALGVMLLLSFMLWMKRRNDYSTG